MSGLPVVGSDQPWSGGSFSATVTCLLAPNPSPMTLDGTNTWLIGDPGASIVVIDPGPDDDAHLRSIVEAADGRVTQILLTHGHPDHAEGARHLHAMTGAPVRALDPEHTLGGEGLDAGMVIAAGDEEIHVIATPGHTSDCLSFHLPRSRALLTGDTVLGRGTTVVAWPDGHLGDYLDSLAALRSRAEVSQARAILPGHGPVLHDPVAVIEAYLDHRRARLDQVRAARARGARTPEEVVDAVYVDIPDAVRWAALLSTRAQLAFLEDRD
ncbi:MAG: MBL fold metallo-hydrolase [Actinobacteria bacterium]|nr:MBL fold metallo-hydrolase [Actinomycetota bacterium]